MTLRGRVKDTDEVRVIVNGARRASVNYGRSLPERIARDGRVRDRGHFETRTRPHPPSRTDHTLLDTPTAIMSAVAAPPASFAARASAHVRGATSYRDRVHLLARAPVRARLPHAKGPLAMAPFRNPFAPKPKPDGPAPPSGAEVLMERVKKGRDKAEREGFQSVLADVRDGVAQRNYGNGGSWPEAAEARRRGRCPRCDADTSEAAERAEREGIKVDAMGDPVEQAKWGQHPLGWCEACAEGNRLVDVSGGF